MIPSMMLPESVPCLLLIMPNLVSSSNQWAFAEMCKLGPDSWPVELAILPPILLWMLQGICQSSACISKGEWMMMAKWDDDDVMPLLISSLILPCRSLIYGTVLCLLYCDSLIDICLSLLDFLDCRGISNVWENDVHYVTNLSLLQSTLTMVKASDVVLILVAIIFPPAAALAVTGCSCDLLINILLTMYISTFLSCRFPLISEAVLL